MRHGEYFDLEKVDGDHLRYIGEKLRSYGFTERGVRKRLGLTRLADLSEESIPYYLMARLYRDEPIDLAISLFLLQQALSFEKIESLLDSKSVKALTRLRVLVANHKTQEYRAAVSLYPQRDLLIFTDHRFCNDEWVAARWPRNPVPFMDDMAHFLMRATVRRPVKTALEVCCGAGFQAIYAASFVDRVMAVDGNPRAVNFARLNAILNNTWNITFVEGDLFEPVRGERFDYIAVTPPSAPSPGYDSRSYHGGPSGADYLRRIIAAIPDFLTSGGFAQVATFIGEREGENYLDRVRRWLTGANMNMHALRLENTEVDAFIKTQMSLGARADAEATRFEMARWIDNFRAQRFRKLFQVILTVEWNDDRAAMPWTQEDEVKFPRRSIGEDITQVFAARRRTRRAGAVEQLEECIPSVPDDIILAKRRVPSGEGFIDKDFRVTWRNPALSPELEIKPLVCELLETIDGRSLVPDLIEKYATKRGVPVASIEKKARQAFLAMYERGLITLDIVAGAKRASSRVPAAPAEVPESMSEAEDELLDPDAIPDLDDMLQQDPGSLPEVHLNAASEVVASPSPESARVPLQISGEMPVAAFKVEAEERKAEASVEAVAEESEADGTIEVEPIQE